VKTGSFAFKLNLLFDFRQDRTLKGQHDFSSKGKMSTKSPSFDMCFGLFTCISILPSLNCISPQSKHVFGEKFFPELESISPTLKLPKNSVQHAAQKTLLLSEFQSEMAISCPIIFRISSVMTFLVGEGGEDRYSIFFPPLT